MPTPSNGPTVPIRRIAHAAGFTARTGVGAAQAERGAFLVGLDRLNDQLDRSTLQATLRLMLAELEAETSRADPGERRQEIAMRRDLVARVHRWLAMTADASSETGDA